MTRRRWIAVDHVVFDAFASAADTTLGVAYAALGRPPCTERPAASLTSPPCRRRARSSASRSSRRRALHSSNCDATPREGSISRRCASSVTRNDAYACVHADEAPFLRALRRGEACGPRSSVSPGCESSSSSSDEQDDSPRRSDAAASQSLAPSHAAHGDADGRMSYSALTRRVPTRASSSTTRCG